MPMMKEGGKPAAAREVVGKANPKAQPKSARESRQIEPDLRLERMKALADLYRAPRVDRDVTPITPNPYSHIQEPMNRIPMYLQREPTYPLEDVDPFDIEESMKTLWELKKKRDALGMRQQPMYRTPTYEVPIEPPVYKL